MLINQGYQKISEIQASQTAINLFYATTSQNLKSFFQKNWLKISITGGIIILLILVFWTTIKRTRLKARLNNLDAQKEALDSLIKNLQSRYFKTKDISETEYAVKMERFKEMIRDIDRQIPMLREEMLKLNKSKQKKKTRKK